MMLAKWPPVLEILPNRADSVKSFWLLPEWGWILSWFFLYQTYSYTSTRQSYSFLISKRLRMITFTVYDKELMWCLTAHNDQMWLDRWEFISHSRHYWLSHQPLTLLYINHTIYLSRGNFSRNLKHSLSSMHCGPVTPYGFGDLGQHWFR